MPRKKEIPTDELAAIMKYLMEAPEMPIPAFSFDFDVEEFDLSAYPPLSSVLGKKPTSDATMLPVSGSRPICIRVPAWVLRAFKIKAAATGQCYQTLMNRSLAATAKGYL